MGLFSRRVVGWAMDKHIDRHLVINALLMAIWQHQAKGEVLAHSDQNSQYASAVAEKIFATFKKRVTKRKIYWIRDETKTEILYFIEMFYNPVKRHTHTGGISPAKYEESYFLESSSVQ